MRIYGLQGMGQVANIPGAIQGGAEFKLQQDAINEQKRLENTTWLAGAAKFGLDNWGQPGILEQLVEEGKRRGILDPQMDASAITKRSLIEIYNGAKTTLGQPDAPFKPDLIKDAEGYQRFASGDRFGERAFPGVTTSNTTERKITKDAMGRQRYVDTGEYVFPNMDDSGLVTPREKFDQDAAKLAADREREARIASDLSSVLEKTLIESQDKAQKSNVQSQELFALADGYESNPDVLSGKAGNAWEGVKLAFGAEDAISLLRRRYAAVINSQVINNLPPGVASDRDIELAREGFLPPTAKPEIVASFLRGLAKMEALNSEFHRFRADYIGRERKAEGFLPAWESELKSRVDAAPEPPPTPTGPQQITNEQEYNSLPPGTMYIDPNGQLRQKQ